ncbi:MULTISPECIES: aldo/keto reductase [unclassified Frigoribacterium]|uniref:aldo/keto reductase n=1 Tax=unclassified Frigoribacterium TaxID=2627005 RepID=UPI0015632AC1|nr:MULTISPECIES: aldo/keto reductase [unclassified Frigoribacterium]NQW85796.1 aldo/keto reductase [Frigoribacterium sp. VKM Ac-2860]NQX07128.1 aldo/keto reductase [Frigoribacterium sp. VKM Ac-2859]
MTTPATPTNPAVALPDGRVVPALGQGTWNIGDDPRRRADEVAALRAGLDAGLTMIDTAEMYGGGRSEQLVGEAIAGRRDEVFLVSKVLPGNASRRGTVEACHASLERLGTDRLDLYLLHWRGRHPLAETVEALEALVAEGAIGGWGVSNFDVDDLHELLSVPGGQNVQTNQVLYNLARRGPEFDLLPWAREHGVPLTSYSPVDGGELLGHPVLEQVATDLGVSSAQLALAWVLRLVPDLMVAVKAGTVGHTLENAAALAVDLDDQAFVQLERAFPVPTTRVPLEMR